MATCPVGRASCANACRRGTVRELRTRYFSFMLYCCLRIASFMCCWVIVCIISALPGTDASSSCPRSCHNFTLVSAPLFHEMNTEVDNNCEASLEEGQESNKRSHRTPGSREKAATTEVNTSYCIRYENNASKRWDGKELATG